LFFLLHYNYSGSDIYEISAFGSKSSSVATDAETFGGAIGAAFFIGKAFGGTGAPDAFASSLFFCLYALFFLLHYNYYGSDIYEISAFGSKSSSVAAGA
jgi:hypothetical protein